MTSYTQGPRRAGGFTSLGMTAPLMRALPQLLQPEIDGPLRKQLEAPIDKNRFVKAIRQCFIKNPRLMPMTRIMLTLISGWAGDGRPIETTIGIIAKHLGKSRRQVCRYLKDAVEEGYLFYSRTKNRKGMYTGVKLRLNLNAIRFFPKKKPTGNPRIQDVTHRAKTNSKYILPIKRDDELWGKLLSFGENLGYFEKASAEKDTT
ncbi:MAG: hypothetical protein AAF731_12245 [Bacteroidota bacterium]